MWLKHVSVGNIEIIGDIAQHGRFIGYYPHLGDLDRRRMGRSRSYALHQKYVRTFIRGVQVATLAMRSAASGASLEQRTLNSKT